MMRFALTMLEDPEWVGIVVVILQLGLLLRGMMTTIDVIVFCVGFGGFVVDVAASYNHVHVGTVSEIDKCLDRAGIGVAGDMNASYYVVAHKILMVDGAFLVEDKNTASVAHSAGMMTVILAHVRRVELVLLPLDFVLRVLTETHWKRLPVGIWISIECVLFLRAQAFDDS